MSRPPRGNPLTGQRTPIGIEVEHIVPPGSKPEEEVTPLNSDSAEPASPAGPPLVATPAEPSSTTPPHREEPGTEANKPRPGNTTQSLRSTDQRTQPEATRNVTISLLPSQQNKAKQAVIQTGPQGGPISLSEFMRDAIDMYLAHLADEYNKGEPFPEYLGRLRTGRPFK